MERRWKFTYYEILSGVYLMHKLLPVFGVVMPAIIYLLLFGIVFLMSINRILIYAGNMPIFRTVPIFAVSVLYITNYLISFDFNYLVVYIYGELQVLLYGLIILAFQCSFDYYSQKRFFKFVLLCYIITSATTIIGCTVYPSASRILATAATSNPEYISYLKNNIGGFSFVYEITLLSPIIIYLIKFKKISKIAGIPILVLFAVTIIRTEYTTALIIFTISLILCVVKKWDNKKFIFCVITALVIFLFCKTTLSSIFLRLSVITNSDIISSRFKDIVGILNGIDIGQLGSGGSRIQLYQQSWRAFMDTNYLGTWEKSIIGGHSFLLDNIGMFGILGAVAVFFTLRYEWIYAVKPYRKYNFYYYSVYVYTLAVIMAVINPKSNVYIFLFILPLFGSVYSKESKK